MISTYFHEWKHFYKAIILKDGEPSSIITEIPNFKEARQRKSTEAIYLFEISQEEYRKGRQTQREDIENLLHSHWKDEDLVISDNLTDEQIDKFLSSKDEKDD